MNNRNILKLVLFASLIINLVFITIFISDSKKNESIYLLASNVEAKCLNDWKSQDSRVIFITSHQILGPDPFTEYNLLELGGYDQSTSFTYEFSACFKDKFSTVRTIAEMKYAIDFMGKQSKNIGFYKLPNSDEIVVYSNE